MFYTDDVNIKQDVEHVKWIVWKIKVIFYTLAGNGSKKTVSSTVETENVNDELCVRYYAMKTRMNSFMLDVQNDKCEWWPEY